MENLAARNQVIKYLLLSLLGKLSGILYLSARINYHPPFFLQLVKYTSGLQLMGTGTHAI